MKSKYPSDQSLKVEVAFFAANETYIIGVCGAVFVDILQDIQDQLDDDPDNYNHGEWGKRILFDCQYEEAQVGPDGRIEAPSYWDLKEIDRRPL